MIGTQSKSPFMTKQKADTMYRHDMREYRGFTPYQMYLKKWHAKMLKGGNAKAFDQLKKSIRKCTGLQ